MIRGSLFFHFRNEERRRKFGNSHFSFFVLLVVNSFISTG